MGTELQQDILAHVQDAINRRAAVRIVGNRTKDFLGRHTEGNPLEVAGHQGIVNYQPMELVLTARAGTLLTDIEAALAEGGQMLPFEPPQYGDAATLGGTIACGLSGPRRPYTGAARDFVLGCRMINGRGEILHFGGEVMKNVAGYDISRLMAGSLGTLGVILEVSLKVLPRPAREITLVQKRTPEDAIRIMNTWSGKPLPLSATCYDGDHLYVRLSGAASAVAAARNHIGGDALEDAAAFWRKVREHQHAFFAGDLPLWRLSVPPAAAPLKLEGKLLTEWGGAQRWLRSDTMAETIRKVARQAGGDAVLFRGGDRTSEVYPRLPEPLLKIHKNLKKSFDPKGIFNPGRMYPEL